MVSYRDLPSSANNSEDAWEILRTNFIDILNNGESATKKIEYSKIYNHAFAMVFTRRGSELYQGVRQLIVEHVQQLAPKIIAEISTANDVNTVPLFVVVGRTWFTFAEKLEYLRSILLYSEKVYEQSIGAEPIHLFGWKIFRAQVLENPTVKEKMALNPWLVPIRQHQTEHRNVLGMGPHDFIESKRFSSDTIIDILSFLSIAQLGLKCAQVSRQMELLSDYALSRRHCILSPFKISQEDNSGGSRIQCYRQKKRAYDVLPDSFSRGKLSDRQQQLHEYLMSFRNSCRTTVGPLDLPTTEPPSWVAGIDTILLSTCRKPNTGRSKAVSSTGAEDFCISDDVMALLYSLQPKLQHCQLAMDLSILLPWANRLDKTEMLSSFLRLFDSCCFAIHQKEVLLAQQNVQVFLWPLWALFNDFIFTGCRTLELRTDLLSSQVGLDAAKWLMHESTETMPRRLKLHSKDATNWQRTARGVAPMIEQLKEDFPQSLQKRRFFVEFPGRGVHHRDWGEWFNCIGEQLQITQMGIRRLPVEDGLKEFEDFYEHLKAPMQPKVLIEMC